MYATFYFVGFYYVDEASDCTILHLCEDFRAKKSTLRSSSSSSPFALSKTTFLCPPGKRFNVDKGECDWW